MVLQPFEASRAKIAQGRRYIETVEAKFGMYREQHPLELRLSEIDPRRVGGRFEVAVTMPLEIPMTAGDAIHNFRSALDIMAGDVVQLSDGCRKNVSFPICEKAADFDMMIKRKNFDRASVEAIDLLKAIAPYKGGNDAIRALNKLDNTDKHSFIIPTSHSAEIKYLKVGGLRLIGAICGNNFYDISAPVGTSIDFEPVLANLEFGEETELYMRPVIPTLHSFADLVTGVVESFAALFRRSVV